MRHTMYNPGEAARTMSYEGAALMNQSSSQHLIKDNGAGGTLDHAAATGRNLMPQMLAANNESIQNLAYQQSHQLFHSLQQSHQQMPQAKTLKKKKLKKVKGFRAKAPLPLR